MTMPLLIAEELFLLTHDEESGKSRSATADPSTALAGAVLLDLAEQGVLKVDGKKAVVHDDPAGHPLLAEAQAVIANDKKERTVQHWVTALPGKLKPLQDKVGTSLVDRGILGFEEGKMLGVFTTKRWPERDPQPERDLRTGLVNVLARGTTATPHQELLVPLLATLSMVNKIVDKDDRKTARDTAKTMTKAAKDGKLVSASVSQAIQATQTAVIAAVVASTAATTAATTT